MEKNEVFDYFQEIARSAFADMLHDTERNQKYSAALKETIENVKKQGKQANVLGKLINLRITPVLIKNIIYRYWHWNWITGNVSCTTWGRFSSNN